MIPVMQTRDRRPEVGLIGNCYEACFASLLEIDISQVPDFYQIGGPGNADKTRDLWLATEGYYIVHTGPCTAHDGRLHGYSIVRARQHTERDSFPIDVIAYDGKIVHNPRPHCPLDGELTGMTIHRYEVLVPLTPTKRDLHQLKAAATTFEEHLTGLLGKEAAANVWSPCHA